MNGTDMICNSNGSRFHWLILLLWVVLATQARAGNDRLAEAIASAESGKIASMREQADGIVPNLIDELKRRAAQPEDPGNPERSRRLQKALAALGDPIARANIRAQLMSESLYAMAAGFADASEVGGNDMIRAIAERLDDPREGGRPIGPNGQVDTDVAIAAPRHLAVVALSTLITDPSAPRIDLRRITYEEHQVVLWRVWWAKNGHRFGTDS